jgi:predicted permease
MRIRERIERGETPEGARQWALARFGDYEAARAECVMIGERRGRRMARTHWVTDAWQDVRYAVRNLRKRRGFAVVAVLTLALGIGANSSIFSVVNAVLLRSLPYRDAGQLYNVETVYPDGTGYALSAPDFMSVRESHRVFEDVGALTGGVRTLLGRDEPREVLAAQVSDGFFELIGMPVVLGRSFRAEENQPGRTSVTILENGFWRREFGADQGVVGRTLDLAGTPYTVVGVLAPGVGIQGDWDLYTPLSYDSSFDAGTAFARRSEFLYAIGRARAGQTPSQISADMRRVGAELQARFANTNESLTFDVTSFRDGILGDVRRPLLILLGAVGFVLLVACANVANLLLARASSRQGELAVRAALGAGRRRLVRQLVAEALVLGLIGGVLGLGLAFAGTTALVRAQPADIPRLTEVGVDGMVVAFTFTIALFTGFLFGVVPALQATSARLMNAMREGGRGGSGTGGQRLRSALIVAEMASAVVLLVGAGLLVRSFIELTRVDPGFRAEQAVTFRLSLQGSRYAEGQQIRNYFTALSDRLRAVPGVTHVGGSSLLPMSGFSSILSFSVEGAPPPPSNVNPEIAVASVTPQYFDAIGTPLMAGRMFEAQDRSDAPPVVLINEAAVQRWFSGENPVGRRVNVGGLREVVGVVGDVLHRDPGTPPGPQLYVPYDQRTTRTLRIVVRAQGDPLALVAAIRREVRALDANLPLTEITPLRALVDASLARPRFYTSMLTLFAGVALALAAIGIFGVMSYSVAQRQREISVRMALGARRSAVIAMITGRALALAAAGLALGLFAAFALARILESQLFGVAAFDPLTVFVVVLVLGTSAAAASFLPARRAAALDPGLALRDG